jgi:peptide/nickel transport system ATP-binding protein
MEPILSIRNLKTHFMLDDGIVRAVDGVDLDLHAGRTACLVGESGCGKSVTAQSIMRIVPSPPGRIVEGSIVYRKDGTESDLAAFPQGARRLREIRGKEISMIFQEPMTSLSPVHTVGFQIMEVIMLHQNVGKREAREIAISSLRQVGMPKAEEAVDRYPHQLSGGMRQRAMIARALCCRPAILIADEPTTALDVTVQAQILALLKGLRREMGMTLLLITHDLGVVAQTADYVYVFYLGRVVEEAPVKAIFARPLHPYTSALFASIPRLEMTGRISPIAGSVPDPFHVVRGCAFRDRCPRSFGRCETDEVPELYEAEAGHRARCFLHDPGGATREGRR